MRKKLLQFSLIASLLLLAACSNENEAPLTNSERTISITASMEPTTRVNLVEDGPNIAVTWVAGEPLQLIYVQGTTKIIQIVAVKSTSNDGNTAHFTISVPAAINAGQFDLYGVSGGGGINNDGPNPVAVLPTNTNDNGSLYSIQQRNAVMLYFSAPGIETTNPKAAVVFKHLGSLFSITVKDVSQIPSSILNILDEARLVGATSGNTDWAFNIGNGGQSFDLVTGTFITPVGTTGNAISFKPAGAPATAWGWYPILPGQAWPDLQLLLTAADNSVLSTSSIPKAGKTPVAGMNYKFYAEWNPANGGSLDFTAPF